MTKKNLLCGCGQCESVKLIHEDEAETEEFKEMKRMIASKESIIINVKGEQRQGMSSLSLVRYNGTPTEKDL